MHRPSFHNKSHKTHKKEDEGEETRGRSVYLLIFWRRECDICLFRSNHSAVYLLVVIFYQSKVPAIE